MRRGRTRTQPRTLVTSPDDDPQPEPAPSADAPAWSPPRAPDDPPAPTAPASAAEQPEQSEQPEQNEPFALVSRAQRPAHGPDATELHALHFALLAGEATAPRHPRALAELAAEPAWRAHALAALTSVGPGALAAARSLVALADHPEVALALPPPDADELAQLLLRALAHARFAVWSRAARAAGRLAGALPSLPAELARLLEPTTALTLRRRAHTALGTLANQAPAELRARRDALLASAAEPWLCAALALGVPDRVALDRNAGVWVDTAIGYANRGGPESWAAVALALREVVARNEGEGERARTVAEELRAAAETIKNASPADTELVERTLALAGRLLSPGEALEVTPWVLVNELAARTSREPADAALEGALEELFAHTDNAVASALRAISQDNPRVAARASLVLEEVVDLLVDGDLGVAAAHLADPALRARALANADALRRKMLRTVWTGLRRPTPATPVWRRWLLRTATVLPRVAPFESDPRVASAAVLEQMLDTLERVADDPSLGQPALQRFVIGAVTELSELLRPTLEDDAALAVLVWMAARNGAMPAHARMRRALESVPAERVDRLFFLVAQLEKGAPAPELVVQDLAELAGERCRVGLLLMALSNELAALKGRRPEAHWSGLPRFDLSDLARITDDLRRAREDAAYALTLDPPREGSPAGETLLARAARLNRSLTSTSLKFVDATRRAEIVEQYVNELGMLCEAIATACGPVVGTPVRAQLAKALVAVRAAAAEVAKDRAEDVRYIARLRVLGALASADEGGMTSTYLAEGPAPGKRVVVKLLPWERFAGVTADVARTLFEREMQRLAPCVHPNVVSLIDAGFVDEGAYIALEYIPGASMETLLRKHGPLDLARLGPIVRDVARGLDYLHARGVVHRDIKPGNILVQIEGAETSTAVQAGWPVSQFVRSVVIDLGIAAEARGAGGDDASEGLVGTPGYLAPEIARGLDLITPAIDVYALAVVVFEALTGTNPYVEGEAELATVLVRHGTMLLPLEQLPEETQRPALLHLLAESCKLDPRTRPSMREFLTRWNALLR